MTLRQTPITHVKMRLLAGLDESWKDRAACRRAIDTREATYSDFYPERGQSTRPAKQICSRCPVRRQCLDYAIGAGERFGIWGGLSERERRRIRRRLRQTRERRAS